ncbi:hypothetical protein [Rhodococcus koreensis]|uniref:hypothetical protein n=1 Tax=Rhodococcus koreensis TaxID=99653 RepID=UPI0036DEB6E0
MPISAPSYFDLKNKAPGEHDSAGRQRLLKRECFERASLRSVDAPVHGFLPLSCWPGRPPAAASGEARIVALTRLSGRTQKFSLTADAEKDSAADFLLVTEGRHVGVEVKYQRRPLGSRDLERIERQAELTGRPTLVVTNAPLSSGAMMFNSKDRAVPLEIVQWSGGNDDDLLTRAVLRLTR